MKRKIKEKTVFWVSTVFLFVFNIVGIIIFRQRIMLSINTLVLSVTFVFLLFQGVRAYSTKDEYLFFSKMYRTSRFYRYNRPTQQQLKDFYIKATVYFAFLPFYLPLTVFSSEEAHILWALLLLISHILAIVGVDIMKFMILRKAQKIKESDWEEEKKKQEHLESMGKWK